MSFYNNLNKNIPNNLTTPLLVNSKPKLVDRNIIKKIKKKKIIAMKNNEMNSYSFKFKEECYRFIKKNYGIIIIFTLLIVLLYFRYKDVKERRIKYKKIR